MDWQTVVKAIAPWIGTALTGPFGGMAVSAIADVFGLSDKTTDAVKQALSGATPEQMLALKTADQTFAMNMQKMGFEHIEQLEELAVKDRDSARGREIQTKDITNRVLAYAITLGFFGVLAVFMFVNIPASGRDALNIMLGSLGTAWTGVIAYYFGSSAGSDRKTEIIAQAPAK